MKRDFAALAAVSGGPPFADNSCAADDSAFEAMLSELAPAQRQVFQRSQRIRKSIDQIMNDRRVTLAQRRAFAAEVDSILADQDGSPADYEDAGTEQRAACSDLAPISRRFGRIGLTLDDAAWRELEVALGTVEIQRGTGAAVAARLSELQVSNLRGAVQAADAFAAALDRVARSKGGPTAGDAIIGALARAFAVSFGQKPSCSPADSGGRFARLLEQILGYSIGAGRLTGIIGSLHLSAPSPRPGRKAPLNQ